MYMASPATPPNSGGSCTLMHSCMLLNGSGSDAHEGSQMRSCRNCMRQFSLFSAQQPVLAHVSMRGAPELCLSQARAAT
jgi:hypothetical protein